MGLLTKLKSRAAEMEPIGQPQADAATAAGPSLAGPSPDGLPPDLPPALPPAAPCPSCRSPLFWLDPYQHLHCCLCDRPPSPAMVRKRLVVATAGDAELFGEQHEWEVIPVDQRHRRATGGLSANSLANPGDGAIAVEFQTETFEIDLGLGAGLQRWSARGSSMIRVSPPCNIRHGQIDPWAMYESHARKQGEAKR